MKFVWCERRYEFVRLVLDLLDMTSSYAALFKIRKNTRIGALRMLKIIQLLQQLHFVTKIS